MASINWRSNWLSSLQNLGRQSYRSYHALGELPAL